MKQDLTIPSLQVKKYVIDAAKERKVKKDFARLLRVIRTVNRLLHRKVSYLPRRTVTDYWYDMPIEPNTVLLCGLGRNVNGSLKYLLDVLNKDERFEGYRIYVRTTYEQTDEMVNRTIQESGWTRTTTVPEKYDMRMETCQYLLTESWFPYQYIKKPGQTVINIWHGTPLKHLGVLLSGDKCHVNAQVQKNFLCADYLLYPNEFTRDVLWDSFTPAHLLKAKALMMGYPRTAGILKVTDDEKKELRSMLAPNGEKIFAYMPTFREYMDDDEFIDYVKPVLEYLDENLTDSQILYVNLHHYHYRNNYLDCDSFRHIRKFPESVETYRLLSVTDALISDYSSIFFDFLITGRKVILYIEDLDEYLKHQGLNMDIRKLPLDLAYSREELLEKLNSPDAKAGDQDTGSDKTDIHDLYKFDASDNPEKLCGLFLGSEEGLNISDIPHASVPSVLLYSDGFVSSDETALLKALSLDQNHDGFEIYVGCDEDVTEQNKEKAYPWLHEVKVIASQKEQPLSRIGAPVKDLYLSGKLPFSQAVKCLQHDYALSYIRMYGDAKIDLICIMDSRDPETIIGTALSGAAHKVLFISSEAARALRSGDRFLRDAVRFSAGYYDLLLTCGSTGSSDVESFIDKKDRPRLLHISTAEEAEEIIRHFLSKKQ